MKYDSYSGIKDLVVFSPRQGKNLDRTAVYICRLLSKFDISYAIQKFSLEYPKTEYAKLYADGKEISCKSSTRQSGIVPNKDNVLSSLTKTTKQFTNINFNPYSKAISLATCSIKPSLTISSVDVPKILSARDVSGRVKIKRMKQTCENILVGNVVNPRALVFSHYDSIETGAIDNASGTAVSLDLIINHSEILSQCLFVLSGNEELSYDEPIYWGHGYRMFEKKYSHLLRKSTKNIIVDCVGHTTTQMYTDSYWVEEAFPVTSLHNILSKTVLLAGDIYKLMEVYHSNLDTLKNIKKNFLQDATQKTLALL